MNFFLRGVLLFYPPVWNGMILSLSTCMSSSFLYIALFAVHEVWHIIAFSSSINPFVARVSSPSVTSGTLWYELLRASIELVYF